MSNICVIIQLRVSSTQIGTTSDNK